MSSIIKSVSLSLHTTNLLVLLFSLYPVVSSHEFAPTLESSSVASTVKDTANSLTFTEVLIYILDAIVLL